MFSTSAGSTTLPSDYTFTPADAGVAQIGVVTFYETGTHWVVAQSGAISGRQENIVVGPADAAAFVVQGIEHPATVDDSLDVEVVVLDAYSNRKTDYLGTIHFSSSDVTATLPADYTFIAADNGQALFADDVQFGAVGIHWVRAEEGGVSGRQENIEVTDHQVFRSVGYQNETVLAEGNASVLLSIVQLTAVFDAPLPALVGVGDAVVYDTDQDTLYDAVAFIRARKADDTFIVRAADDTKAQAVVTATPDWAIFRAYSSLGDVQTGSENAAIPTSLRDFDAHTDGADLVTLDQIWNIACYADAPHVVSDSGYSFAHWVTSPTRYLRFFTPYRGDEVGIRQRHSGSWDDDAFYLIRSSVGPDGYGDPLLYLTIRDVRIEGLQCMENSGCCFLSGIQTAAADHRFSHNILRGSGIEGMAIRVTSNLTTARIWNNLVYQTAADEGDGVWLEGDVTAYVYNNTIYSAHRGVYLYAATVTGANVHLKNNLVLDNVGSAVSGWDIDDKAATYAADSIRNCTSDATASLPGLQNGLINQSSAAIFAADFLTTGDFDQLPTSPCQNVGVDLSTDPDLPVTTDLAGNTRPRGTDTWDLGALEN